MISIKDWGLEGHRMVPFIKGQLGAGPKSNCQSAALNAKRVFRCSYPLRMNPYFSGSTGSICKIPV